MQGQHSHGVAYYRCRFPLEYSPGNHPRNVIMREELLIRPLNAWLAQEFGPAQRRHTVAKLVEQVTAGVPTEPAVPAGPTVVECDAKLARYRAALEARADPAVVANWITETQTERQCAQQPHQAADGISQLTEDQIIAIVEELGDMITALRHAEPEHKLEVYRSLGLRLTYSPETQTVRAEIDLAAHRWDSVGVRGATRTIPQRTAVVAAMLTLK